MKNLSIGTTSIRQLDGLYNLNDLHNVSGSAEKHQPNKFLRLAQTKELVEEISKWTDLSISNNQAVTSKRGANGGTFACKELVYAYAMWISPKFHLHVIRAFDAMQSAPMQPALPAHPALAIQQPVGFDAQLIQPIQYDGQQWMTSGDIAHALGYASASSIRKIHSRNKVHFDHTATRVLKLKRGGRGMRVFSKKGCQLLAGFSGSENALDLFNWAYALPGESVLALPDPDAKKGNALALASVDIQSSDQNVLATIASLLASHHQSGEPCTITLRLAPGEKPLIKTMDGQVTCFENNDLIRFVKFYQKVVKISLEKTDALNEFLKGGSFINPSEVRS